MDTRAGNGLETPMQLPYNLCFWFATSVFPVFFYHMFKMIIRSMLMLQSLKHDQSLDIDII